MPEAKSACFAVGVERELLLACVGATSSNPFDVLNPARAAARPAPKVAAAQKVKRSGDA